MPHSDSDDMSCTRTTDGGVATGLDYSKSPSTFEGLVVVGVAILVMLGFELALLGLLLVTWRLIRRSSLPRTRASSNGLR